MSASKSHKPLLVLEGEYSLSRLPQSLFPLTGFFFFLPPGTANLGGSGFSKLFLIYAFIMEGDNFLIHHCLHLG